MSIGDGIGHRWGRNGEVCVAVAPATRAAGILAYGSNRLKGQKG